MKLEEIQLGDRVNLKPAERAVHHGEPAQGLKVIDPATGYVLPATGKEVIFSTFWFKRVQHGDCVLMDEKAPLVLEKTATEEKSAVRTARKEKGE